MALKYLSLTGLQEALAADNNYTVTIQTPQGLMRIKASTLYQFFTGNLQQQIDEIELAEAGKSIWPSAKTLSLTGAVSGSVAFDGSSDFSLNTVIADASIEQTKIIGLGTKFLSLDANVDNLVERMNDVEYQLGNQEPSSGVAWLVVNANQTLEPNTSCIADATSAALTLTLPAVLGAGRSFTVRAFGGTVTIGANGHQIENLGAGTDLQLQAGETVSLVAVNTTTLAVVAASTI